MSRRKGSDYRDGAAAPMHRTGVEGSYGHSAGYVPRRAGARMPNYAAADERQTTLFSRYQKEREEYEATCHLFRIDPDTATAFLEALTIRRLILGYRHPVTKPNHNPTEAA